MYCKNCGHFINNGENYCGTCGVKVEYNQVQQNQYQQQTSYTNQQYNQQQTSYTNQQYNYQPKTVNMDNYMPNYSNNFNYIQRDDEDYLIDAYIGKNADKLKNGDFSINTFFLGIFYIIYRKMWLLTIIYEVITMIVSIFLPTFSSLISIAIGIFLSIKFKSLYINHVKEKVEKIERDNPNKTKEELYEICKKKGGTSLLAVVIYIILNIVIVGLITASVYYNYIDKIEDYIKDNYEQEATGLIGNLSVTIPDNFEEAENSTNDYKYYSYLEITSQSSNLCTLSLSVNKSYYDNEIDYLNNMFYVTNDKKSQITKNRINKEMWYTMSTKSESDTTYYYVIMKKGLIYKLKYTNYDNSAKCEEYKNTIINSLKFN